MKATLENLEVNEVSLVDLPAIGRPLAVIKSADQIAVPEILCVNAAKAITLAAGGAVVDPSALEVAKALVSGMVDVSIVAKVAEFFAKATPPTSEDVEWMAYGGECGDTPNCASAVEWACKPQVEKTTMDASDVMKAAQAELANLIGTIPGLVTEAIEKSLSAQVDKAVAAALEPVQKAMEMHQALLTEKIDAAKMVIDQMAAVAAQADSDEWWSAYNTLDNLMSGIRQTAQVVGVTIPVAPESVDKSAGVSVKSATATIKAFVEKGSAALAQTVAAVTATKSVIDGLNAKLAEPLPPKAIAPDGKEATAKSADAFASLGVLSFK